MSIRIISDSSADISEIMGVDFKSVPLKIVTDTNEYVDDANLDVENMVGELASYNGKSGSSCPNIDDWKNAMGSSQEAFCLTITSGLSGSYNSASLAVSDHLKEDPSRKAMVIDTLSTGPENALIAEKLADLVKNKCAFEEIKEKIIEYMKNTHLIFCLECLNNLANNGRVNKAVAKISGILGIRIVGVASEVGTLEICSKARGSAKAIEEIYKIMKNKGFSGGRVRIHHCLNLPSAKNLSEMIRREFPKTDILIQSTGGLCSFYAERGGILVGFEG